MTIRNALNESSDIVCRCDVVVIGGGPAGATISALLAEQGWHVELLEKDHHPRFHIGESLLPHTLPILEQLGVLAEIEKIGIVKYGAEVASPYHGRSRILYFSRALDGSQAFAFEVKRAEFDEILFRNCSLKGARVHEGVQAKHVQFNQGQGFLIQAENRAGKPHIWDARALVDASGRDTFLSGQLGGKYRNPHHNSAAIFGHFEAVRRLPGMDEGNISIVWFDHGWFWIIPFKDGTTSVGAVCWPYYIKTRKTTLEQFLWETIALCPPVAERMTNAKLVTPAHAAANYSYRRTTMSGAGYIMLGDAFAFMDPVFSSGVHLALNSAMRGAKVVDAFLRRAPEYSRLLREFERSVRRGVKTYSWFIYRFTQPAFRNLFMSTRSLFKMEEAVLSILAGDAFGKTPTSVPIFLFKLAYYLGYLFNLKENWSAYRRRTQGIPTQVTEVKDYAVNSISEVQCRPEVSNAHALCINYVELARWERLKAAQSNFLGIVHYGGGHKEPRSLRACPTVYLDLPQLNETPLAEVWTSTLPVTYLRVDDIQFAMNDEVLFGAFQLEESPGTPLDVVTNAGYQRLIVQARVLGYPHLLRVWNYFPHINRESDGLERYQRFCIGRYEALAEGLFNFPKTLPAGTAVGTISGPLQIHFLAATRPGTHVENPRQVNAYEYPRIYGPRSPSFARATLRASSSGSELFIAGTASVVGHSTRHTGEPWQQTMETLHNLRALTTHTEQMQGITLGQTCRQHFLKVYIRHPEHLPTISEVLKQQMPADTQVLYLQGEMCRSELLVEIEGILTSR